MKKGQISLEFIILFAVALIVITVFLLLSQEQAVDVNRAKQKTDAMNTVNDLSSAAKQVYAQGPGAKKQVIVRIPQGYDPDKSYVANKTIKLRVAGSDYLDITDFEVRGTLPSTSGTHWVWVASEGSRVTIGQKMVSLDKVTISMLMERNETKNNSFTVTNVWGKAINVTLGINWIVTNVSLETTPTTFEIGHLSSQIVHLDFQSDSDAVGYYTGVIQVTGNDGTHTERATIPLTIEVIGLGVGSPPSLRVTPNSFNVSMEAGNTTSRNFIVCTNSQTALDDVLVTPSLGSPGSWISAPASIGPLSTDDCRNVVLNVTVPNGTYSNNYTGFILFDGQGGNGADDTIALKVEVGGLGGDTVGPTVSNINKTPSKTLMYDPVTFTAIADDSMTGNSTIKQCEMNINGDQWILMDAVDGTFDEPIENITYTYVNGLGFGIRTANIRCIDSKNNIGPMKSYQFKIMKSILFITKGPTFWTWDEWDWIFWIWLHNSNEGYRWDLDEYTVDQVLGEPVDTSMYTTIIMAEYTENSSITSTLTNFESNGGSVVLVGEAVKYGPQSLGVTGDVGSARSENDVDIIDNSHYITTGYAIDDIRILSGNSPIYYITSFNGTTLANSEYASNRTVLGYKDRYLFWGPTRPYRFYVNGDQLSTRVVDYAIMNSVIE